MLCHSAAVVWMQSLPEGYSRPLDREQEHTEHDEDGASDDPPSELLNPSQE